jgi:hypothetical protein
MSDSAPAPSPSASTGTTEDDDATSEILGACTVG